MGVQKRLAKFGIAKQTAKGAAAANATYGFGLTGGTIVTADVQEEDLNTTWDSRIVAGHDRLGVVPGAEIEVVAFPKMLGLLLYGACGAITTTGVGPYSHAIKVGDDLPYLTGFARQGASYYKMADAKVSSLAMEWDRIGSLKASATLMGLGLEFLAGAYTETAAEKVADGTFRGVGGIFTVDGAAATIKSGSISIENSIEAVVGSGAVLPTDVFPGDHALSVSLTIVPDDLNLFRTVITGSAGGSSVASTPKYGTAQLKFILDANTDLDLTINRMKFATEFPAADPAGGPVEIPLEGMVARPAGATDPYVFTLRNSVATY